jgi:hypothetical protein
MGAEFRWVRTSENLEFSDVDKSELGCTWSVWTLDMKMLSHLGGTTVECTSVTTSSGTENQVL